MSVTAEHGKLTDHQLMAILFSQFLVKGVGYTLRYLIDLLRSKSTRFQEVDNHYIRTMIGQVTDIGEEKKSQHSKQFIVHGDKKRNSLRYYVGLPLTEVEKQHFRNSLSRRERDFIEGKETRKKWQQKRRDLRGKDSCNVVAKMNAQRNRCGICGLPFIPTHYIHVDLDHIIPLGNDGEDVLENTRATHTGCNRELGDCGNDDQVRRKLVEYGHPVDADAAIVATAQAKEVKEMVRSVKQPSRQPQEAPRETKPQVDEAPPPAPQKKDLEWFVDQFAENLTEEDRKNSSPGYQYNRFCFWLVDKKGHPFVDKRQQDGRLTLELFIPLIEKHLYQPEEKSPPKNPHVRTGRRLGWKESILQRQAERKEKLRAWKERNKPTDTEEE